MTQALPLFEPLPSELRPKHKNKRVTIKALAAITGTDESTLRAYIKVLFEMLQQDGIAETV
jgi:hypothetical protein